MLYSVKDKNNLLSINVWCGGDYTNNVAGTSGTLNAEVSSDYCYDGDYSFKLTSSEDSYKYLQLGVISALEGDTCTASLTILNNSGENITLRLTQSEDNSYQNVTIPSSSDPQNISISKTLTLNSNVSIRLISYSPVTFYIDNISATIQ